MGQFRNEDAQTLSLEAFTLDPPDLRSAVPEDGSEAVTGFTGSLESGKSIRVHTGNGTGFWDGDVFHLFLSRKNYIWNNRCGDLVASSEGPPSSTRRLREQPIEGDTLKRVPGTNWLG